MAGVAHTPHLEKRPSGYFFRRRLPSAFREISNPGQSSAICLSLRTDVLSEATCRVAVHPKLVELGLLHFVEMRRRQKQSRLFPNLNRGQTKDTFSELYSKIFGYYRKTNDCYWPGLDFHAFRTTCRAVTAVHQPANLRLTTRSPQRRASRPRSKKRREPCKTNSISRRSGIRPC